MTSRPHRSSPWPDPPDATIVRARLEEHHQPGAGVRRPGQRGQHAPRRRPVGRHGGDGRLHRAPRGRPPLGRLRPATSSSSGRRARCGPARWSSRPVWPARRPASSPRSPRWATAATAWTAGRPCGHGRWPACTTPSWRSAPASCRRGSGDTCRWWSRRGGLAGGRVAMPGDVSSQFVTALMLVAPATAGGHRDRAHDPARVAPVPGHHGGGDGRLRRPGGRGGGAASSGWRRPATAAPTTRSSRMRRRPRTCGRRRRSPAGG